MGRFKFLIPVFFFLYLLPSGTQPLHAQVIITGTAETPAGEPVAGASVIIRQQAGKNPFSFTTTGTGGKFSINVPENYAGCLLEITHISFHPQTITLNAGANSLRLILQQKQAVTLPKVTVKAPPLQRTGDTMKYRVSAFSTSADRVIGDVIDKLPGLQRNENGQILYNGRAINKYYIEGLDLMGSQYGIANETIRFELVDQVEIWERHQPIKVLDSSGAKNEVALNLKLTSKAKNVWNGNFSTGAGLPFFSGEGAANLMKFAPGFQTLISLRMNNVGENLLPQLNELTVNPEDWEQSLAPVARYSPLTIPVPTFKFLSEKRRLFNETAMPVINLLKSTRSGLQWRLNTQAFTDQTENEFGTVQEIFLPAGNIRLEEFQMWQQRQRGLIAGLQAEKNSNDVYLRVKSKTELRQTSQNSIVTGSFPSAQQMRHPFIFSDNSAESVKKTKSGNALVRFRAATKFFQSGTRLVVAPGIFKEVLNNNLPMNFVRQEAPVQSLWGNIRWSLLKQKDRWNRQFFFKADAQRDYLSSALFKDSSQTELRLGPRFQNRFTLAVVSAQAGVSVSRQIKRLSVQAELPVGRQWMLRNDLNTGNRIRQQLLLFLPSFTAMYKWQQFTLSLQGKTTVLPVTWQQNYNNFITTDYRTVSAYSDSFLIQRTWNTGLGLNYINPLKGWSGFISVILSNTLRNQLSSVMYNGIFTDQYFLQERNRQQTISLMSGMGKYITPLKGAVQLNAQYGRFRGPAIQNDRQFIFTNQSMSAKLKVFSRAINRLHLESLSNVSVTRASNNITGRLAPAVLWQQSLVITAGLIPNKLLLQTSGEWGASQQQSGTFPFSFYNAVLSWRRKAIEWRLECYNLLNTDRFVMPAAVQNQQMESYIILRPATVLLKCSFIL